jgi:hypothetical protein
MSNLKNLWARILATIGGECAALGFEKRGSASYTKCIHVDVIGVVSFAGDRSEDGKLVVMPSVAVRNHTLEHLLTELIGEKPNPFGSGTLACTLGHVPPNSQLSWFYFSDDENPGPQISELFRIVKQTALPWMEQHRHLDSFIKDLQSAYRFARRDSVRVRLPAAYYLKGDFDRARSLVNQGLEEIGGEDGPVSRPYIRFAEGLLARMPAASK